MSFLLLAIIADITINNAKEDGLGENKVADSLKRKREIYEYAIIILKIPPFKEFLKFKVKEIVNKKLVKK